MTPEFIDDMLKCYGPGTVTMAVCDVCGYHEWISTNRDGFDKVVETQINHCPKCAEAYHRAPEVVVWVLNVVGRMKEKA